MGRLAAGWGAGARVIPPPPCDVDRSTRGLPTGLSAITLSVTVTGDVILPLKPPNVLSCVTSRNLGQAINLSVYH